MSSPRRRNVLVICKGNHCRSPIAALILAERAGRTLDVRSAGTRDWHLGRPAHPLMIQAAAGFGYDLTAHRGVLLDRQQIDWADDLLAVDDETADTVQALAGPNRPVHVLGTGITDPWGGELEDFARAVAEIQDAARLFHTA